MSKMKTQLKDHKDFIKLERELLGVLSHAIREGDTARVFYLRQTLDEIY